MTAMYKHVGKVINTDGRCIVVFMQIPGREDHALIINMDGLPPHFERPIRALVESNDGQSATNFADILHRRLMPDTGVRILDALHNARLLQPVHIDNIVMTPRPSMAFPLRRVISEMNEAAGKQLPPQTDFSAEKFNPHLHNQAIRSNEERQAIARNLLAEADHLSAAASAKVAQARSMAPEMFPTKLAEVAAPVVPPARLDIVEDNGDIASSQLDYVEPQVVDCVIETATASQAQIERYAAMMLGETIEPVSAPAAAAKKAKSPAAKPPAAKPTAAKPTAAKPKTAKRSGKN